MKEIRIEGVERGRQEFRQGIIKKGQGAKEVTTEARKTSSKKRG